MAEISCGMRSAIWAKRSHLAIEALQSLKSHIPNAVIRPQVCSMASCEEGCYDPELSSCFEMRVSAEGVFNLYKQKDQGPCEAQDKEYPHGMACGGECMDFGSNTCINGVVCPGGSFPCGRNCLATDRQLSFPLLSPVHCLIGNSHSG